MIDFGKITFSMSYEDGQSVTHTIRGDSTLDEVVEAFEYFIKGAGFNLTQGQHIGYEYDDEDPEIHPIGDLSDTDEYCVDLSSVSFGVDSGWIDNKEEKYARDISDLSSEK
jgi:hypothetical protein